MPELNQFFLRFAKPQNALLLGACRRWMLPTLLSLMCLALEGCGSGGKGPSGLVAGKVTLQDKPLGSGYIAFSSSAKGTAAGATLNAAGEYKLTDRLPVGDYVVTVTPPPAPPPLSVAPGTPPPKSEIPAKYRTETKSDLKFPVKAGANTANFDLKP
ncbi:MAG: hypothetical protein V4719_11950 [Planctomycetota bacterium]